MKFLLLISNSAIYPQVVLWYFIQHYSVWKGAAKFLSVCWCCLPYCQKLDSHSFSNLCQSAFFIGLGILFVFLKHCLSWLYNLNIIYFPALTASEFFKITFLFFFLIFKFLATPRDAWDVGTKTCGILVPQLGIEPTVPHPLQWKCRVLNWTTREVPEITEQLSLSLYSSGDHSHHYILQT